LLKEGFYIEELNESLNCVDLSNYSVLMFIDTEKKLSQDEINKLRFFYEENNLAVFIITDWNSNLLLNQFNYIDQDTLDTFNASFP
jgi:hypothetical protein